MSYFVVNYLNVRFSGFITSVADVTLTGGESSQGELIGLDSSVCPCVHTFKHKYL